MHRCRWFQDSPKVFNRPCNSRCVGDVHADLLYSDTKITMEEAQRILDAHNAGVQLLTFSLAREAPTFDEFFGRWEEQQSPGTWQCWDYGTWGKEQVNPSEEDTYPNFVTYRLID